MTFILYCIVATVDPFPEALAAIFEVPILPISFYFRFQFQQRGGRMQMQALATQYGLGGYVKRVSRNWLYCVIVFPLNQDVETLNRFHATVETLPHYRFLLRGSGKKYSRYLTSAFEVIKTRPAVLVQLDVNSEEPGDAVSDVSSIVSLSSGLSSHI